MSWLYLKTFIQIIHMRWCQGYIEKKISFKWFTCDNAMVIFQKSFIQIIQVRKWQGYIKDIIQMIDMR